VDPFFRETPFYLFYEYERNKQGVELTEVSCALRAIHQLPPQKHRIVVDLLGKGLVIFAHAEEGAK
jgi:hypothetical protein